MFLANSATKQSKHLCIYFSYHSPSTYINYKQQTNFVAENFLSHTVPWSIHNITHHRHIHFKLPFKEWEVDGRLNVVAKTSATNTATKLSKHQYIPHYPFQTTFNIIFNWCFHVHQGHIQTTLTHLTHSKLPKPTSLFNTTQSTILSSNPDLTQSPPES
jgi:hypothetical protein